MFSRRFLFPLLGVLVALVPVSVRADGLRVTLDYAVPFRNPGSGSRRPSDLVLDLPMLPDGNLAGTGWAWFEDLPEAELPVTVVRQARGPHRLEAELKVEVPHLPPRFTGGTVEVSLDLAMGSQVGEGEFRVQARGLAGVEIGDLWRAAGSFDPPAWRGGLSTDATRSYSRIPDRHQRSIAPVLARAVREPGLAPLPEDLRTADLSLPRDVSAPEHAAWPELRAWLRAPRSPADAAAPLARLDPRALRADQTYELCAALASAAALQALAPGEDKRASAEILARWGRLAAGEDAVETPLRGPSPLRPGGWLEGFSGPEDPRLASIRAAAGLALLAALPHLDGDTRAASHRALERCHRSVRRFLETAVGERGAPTGAFGYATALEFVPAFGWWLEKATGVDLFAGTGWAEAGRFHAASDGLLLRQAEADRFWTVALRPGASPASVTALDRAAATAPPVLRHAWQSLLAELWPAGTPPSAPDGPRIVHDPTMGTLVLGAGGSPEAPLLVFEMGEGPGHGGALPGHFVFRGLGWTWAAQTTAPAGTFGWPARADQNVFQAKEGSLVNLPAAEPTSRGRLRHLRARRDGSGMGSVAFGGFTNLERTDGRDPVTEGRGWRTVGLDVSGESGAAAVLVMVEGATEMGQRRRSWELSVGDVPASRVDIVGPEFTIRPPGVSASLRGRFAYPDTVNLEYRPPRDGRPGRIVAWLDEPQESSEDLLQRSMDRGAIEFQGVSLPGREFGITVEDPLTLDETAEDESERERRQREGRIVVEKIYHWTSSASMAAGADRRRQAFGSLAVVLTLAEGSHPPVEIAPAREEPMFKVGGMPVWYREHQIWFGKEGF